MTKLLIGRLILTALLACSAPIGGCATRLPPSMAADPPQLQTPAEAARPCSLAQLSSDATESDLDQAYTLRGIQLVECEARRRLAADTHHAEHDLEAQWLDQRADRARPWWKFWNSPVH